MEIKVDQEVDPVKLAEALNIPEDKREDFIAKISTGIENAKKLKEKCDKQIDDLNVMFKPYSETIKTTIDTFANQCQPTGVEYTTFAAFISGEFMLIAAKILASIYPDEGKTLESAKEAAKFVLNAVMASHKDMNSAEQASVMGQPVEH